MIRRFLIGMSTIIFMVCSIWLAAFSMSHTEMAAANDCAISASTADCAGTPEHALHVLAHRVQGLHVIGGTLPTMQDLLTKLVLAAGLAILAFGVAADHLLGEKLRRAIQLSRILVHTAEQRFYAWRVTIQELYPHFAH